MPGLYTSIQSMFEIMQKEKIHQVDISTMDMKQIFANHITSQTTIYYIHSNIFVTLLKTMV